jgi:hypothetical protein
MARLSLDGFTNFFRFYNGEEQQNAGIEALWKAMPVSLLEEDADWIKTFRSKPAPKPSEGSSGPITPELMSRYSGHPAKSFDATFCDDFNKLLHITGFDTDLTAFRMLLAQCAHETANWVYMKELGSESYFYDMYENRGDLGNTQKGDGARFSGCGPIQVTGRYNFQDSYNYLVQMDGINDPRFMAEGTPYVSVAYPFRVCIGWLIKNNYFELCKGGDLLACTRRLNGGTNGLDDRQYWWDQAKAKIRPEDLR